MIEFLLKCMDKMQVTFEQQDLRLKFEEWLNQPDVAKKVAANKETKRLAALHGWR